MPGHGGTAPRILLIEDDPIIGEHLRAGLAAHGYNATWQRTGTAGMIAAQSQVPDVVLVDLGLPDMDGVEVARTLRSRQPDLLIVIVTARDDDLDVVVGLDAGADDYLTKPVSITVLLARLRAHLRTRPAPGTSAPLRAGPLVLDPATRRCLLGTVPVELRPKEFDLLAALLAAPGQALSREDLMARVWDENWFGSTKTLDVTMASLRQRLDAAADADLAPPAITTLRGYGYRLEATQA
jgi:DNA-binding response OmpR family regulator